MFTVCYFLYFSLLTDKPDYAHCVNWDADDTKTALESCVRVDLEPLKMCRANRVGPTKWFVVYRKLEPIK